MATVDEILTRQAYAAGDETWTKDNNYPSYTMYAEPEYVPVTNKRIADFNDQVSVRGEQNAQFVGFQLPRYDDAMDLTKQNLYIHYQTVYGGSDGVPCNVSWSDNYVRMCWMIPGQATQEPGSIQMMIYATGTNSVGDRTIWKTLPATYTIHDGLEIGGGIPEPDQSWYEQFVQQMEGKVSTAQGYANDAQASKVAAAGSATAAAQSADASAQALQENKDYVESQKETFVGYNKRETDLKYANALIGSASGTGRVTVGDAWEAPIPDLRISGESEQVATTGAQLLDSSKLERMHNEVKFTVEEDGGILVTGNTLQNAANSAVVTVALSPGTYYISGSAPIGDSKIFVRIKLWHGDSSTVVSDASFLVDGTETKIECFLQLYQGLSGFSAVVYPMINTGSTAKPWEPYTGGQPSPSPDYPQPIISTGTVTTGVQLFDSSKVLNKSVGGATIVNNADGSITISGAGTMTGTLDTRCTLTHEETMTLIGNDRVFTAAANIATYPHFYFEFYDKNGAVMRLLLLNVTSVTKSLPAEADMNTLYIQTGYYGRADESIVSGTQKVMVNAGSTALPWEPYTGGKPSPSEEYPQPLDVMVMGDQLFDASRIPNKSTGGATVTNNSDGSFTVAGSGALQENFGNTISLTHEETMALIKSERTFTVYSNVSVYPYFFFNFYDKNGTVKTLQLTGVTKVTESIPNAADMNTLYIKFGYYGMAGEAIVSGTQKVMVNAGSTALPWQPYQSKTATIQLTAPLYGIGEYRDRILCKDGEWGVERNILLGKLTEDTVIPSAGSMTSTYPNCIIDNRYTAIYSKRYNGLNKARIYSNEVKATGYCNIAQAGIVNDWNIPKGGRDNIYTINSLGAIYITVPITALGVLTTATFAEVNTAIKQYVTDHDVYVMFVLDAPTWEPLPAATQSALNALTTFTGTTHINITAGGPEPDVAVEYVQDTRAVIADLQAQIDAIRNGGTT